jgi:hypothetical protein
MRILIISLLCISLSSCNKWDGEINGKKYRLDYICTHSHIVTTTGVSFFGNQMSTGVYLTNVCDAYRLDTVWQKTKNK